MKSLTLNQWNKAMKEHAKTLVFDFPTRIFHWIFAFLFLGAFIIAKTIDDDSSLFIFHMLAGLTIGFIILLRLIWGFAGTTYARFSSFKLHPVELIQYMKDAIFVKAKRYIGHNPASSYAAIIMFICAIGLAATGILMTSGSEVHLYEEIHEILANIFLITVILHVAGIIFHNSKHKDSLWSSMFNGRKKALHGEAGITNSKISAGILLILLTLLWSGYLFTRYDRTTSTLNLFGNELMLGEEEH